VEQELFFFVVFVLLNRFSFLLSDLYIIVYIVDHFCSVIVLTVFLRFIASDYPFGIFKFVAPLGHIIQTTLFLLLSLMLCLAEKLQIPI
jgi:hypothetical protein